MIDASGEEEVGGGIKLPGATGIFARSLALTAHWQIEGAWWLISRLTLGACQYVMQTFERIFVIQLVLALFQDSGGFGGVVFFIEGEVHNGLSADHRSGQASEVDTGLGQGTGESSAQSGFVGGFDAEGI